MGRVWEQSEEARTVIALKSRTCEKSQGSDVDHEMNSALQAKYTAVGTHVA